MPIYEYNCADCDGVTSVFLRSMRQEVSADQRCEHCGSAAISRAISQVARLKTTQDVVDEYGSPAEGGEYRDPRQIGQWVEERFEEYGLDIPDDTREMIDAAREGELPDTVTD